MQRSEPESVTAGRGISPADRELMKRLSIVLVFVFLFVGAFTKLQLLYSHKFFDVTGRAQWIWDPHPMLTGDPVAFFATREFDLPPNRYYTKIKIVGDPEYNFWFNGKEIGGREVGEEATLDVFDVTSLARDKGNRLVVAARSRNGVGGLIASVDISPETENYLVTDGDWKIYRHWSEELIVRDPKRDASRDPRPDPNGEPALRPQLLGEPPMRRWNYLATEPGTPATVFDFGPTYGRLRLTIRRPRGASRVVNVRFANAPAELTPVEGTITPFVFAPGETAIVDPETRHFRYAMVYEDAATAEVVR
ncbi:MAG: hypothetical protein JWO56_1260 [Acidobacteria bacterium]|nr:hypothetical protein [Acidobacteriota bacterium]